MDKKIEETREFLQTIGMPKAQLADICCYVILAMAGIKPDMSWSEATNEWIRIHDIIQFVNTFYGITDLGDLKDVAPDVLLKEMLIEYIKFSFAFRYEEKIRMKRNPEETERLLEKMDKYISNELHNNLKLEDIKTMDFGHLQASEVVKRSLEDAYKVFELFYGEA